MINYLYSRPDYPDYNDSRVVLILLKFHSALQYILHLTSRQHASEAQMAPLAKQFILYDFCF